MCYLRVRHPARLQMRWTYNIKYDREASNKILRGDMVVACCTKQLVLGVQSLARLILHYKVGSFPYRRWSLGAIHSLAGINSDSGCSERGRDEAILCFRSHGRFNNSFSRTKRFTERWTKLSWINNTELCSRRASSVQSAAPSSASKWCSVLLTNR